MQDLKLCMVQISINTYCTNAQCKIHFGRETNFIKKSIFQCIQFGGQKFRLSFSNLCKMYNITLGFPISDEERTYCIKRKSLIQYPCIRVTS